MLKHLYPIYHNTNFRLIHIFDPPWLWFNLTPHPQNAHPFIVEFCCLNNLVLVSVPTMERQANAMYGWLEDDGRSMRPSIRWWTPPVCCYDGTAWQEESWKLQMMLEKCDKRICGYSNASIKAMAEPRRRVITMQVYDLLAMLIWAVVDCSSSRRSQTIGFMATVQPKDEPLLYFVACNWKQQTKAKS